MIHLSEAFSFSFKALRQNPVRSLLTGLGMVIGTASVILVVTISLTSQKYILEQIEGVGSNMIFASYEVGSQQSSAEVRMTDSRRSMAATAWFTTSRQQTSATPSLARSSSKAGVANERSS